EGPSRDRSRRCAGGGTRLRGVPGGIERGGEDGGDVGLVDGELDGRDGGVGAGDRSLELFAEGVAVLGAAVGVFGPGVPGGLGDADLNEALDLGVGVAGVEDAVVIAGAGGVG